jgi:hypothetical protein
LLIAVALVFGWSLAGAPAASASFGCLSQFGSSGSGDGQFSHPVGVAIDPS